MHKQFELLERVESVIRYCSDERDYATSIIMVLVTTLETLILFIYGCYCKCALYVFNTLGYYNQF